MASVLNSSPRTGRLYVEADTLRYSSVCIECERPATISVRRWSGFRSGLVTLRICDAHAHAQHVRAALLTALGVLALALICLGRILNSPSTSLIAALALAVVVLTAPFSPRSRLRTKKDGVRVSGASVAFALNNRRGIVAERGAILDGWFTVEELVQRDSAETTGA